MGKKMAIHRCRRTNFPIMAVKKYVSYNQNSELEVNKRGNFGRHICNDTLHGHHKEKKFYDPGRAYKHVLALSDKRRSEAMTHNKDEHHHAPFRMHFPKLRDITYMKIRKNTLEYDPGICE